MALRVVGEEGELGTEEGDVEVGEGARERTLLGSGFGEG